MAKINDAFTNSNQPEVYPCPAGNCSRSCESCGGSGYRKRCNKTACFEYGCNHGNHCYISKEDAEQYLEPWQGQLFKGCLGTMIIALVALMAFSIIATIAHFTGFYP